MFLPPHFLRLGLGSILLWSISLPLWSCPLEASSITQIFETTPLLEQRSKVSDRCDFSWARAQQNQLKEISTTPLWNQLVLEHYRASHNEAEALKALQDILSNGPAPKFGSPDPLQGLGFEKLSATAAWDKQTKVLLFAKGKHLYRLQLKVFGFEPEELQSKALAVSQAIQTDKGN